MKRIIYLLITVFVVQSCVHEEENIFGISAAERMQKTIAEHKTLLASAENGWIADYYPEKNHSIGGYAMFMKFNADGTVAVSCEIETNAPAHTADTSQYEVLAEQGPILSFATYNRVMHYFSEPLGSSDVDGRSGDYEFVFMEVVSPNEIHLKGKKQNNKLVLRRNVNNIAPEDYYADVAKIEEDAIQFGLFRFLVEGKVIDSLGVSDRTMEGNVIDIAYTHTPEGIRLYEPLTVDGVTMQNFRWNTDAGRYECTDAGVNAYFEGFLPDDYQLQYEDFLGEWDMQFHGASTTTWTMATVTISTKKKYNTFLLSCDDIFSFAGIELAFNVQKGTVSLLNQNAAIHTDGINYIRVCAYDRGAGYLNTSSTGPIGLFGQWNNDEEGKREILFVDNKVWGTYKPNGILLRLMTISGNVSSGNFTANIGGYRFNDITLTKR
jgi:hypothetical protein